MDHERDPLDVAVDRAHAALMHVAHVAERRQELELQRFADYALRQLMDIWERAE